jgi:hypothetical protein
MTIIFTILGIYFGGMLLFALWDSYIGFGIEFDDNIWPPIQLALGFWPFALVAAIIAGIGMTLQSVKNQRIKKQDAQKRIRVVAEKEQEAILEQIEKEIVEDENLTVSRSGRSRSTQS